MRVLVDNDVSSYLASSGSALLDAISSICFVRFGTRRTFAFGLTSLLGLSGFGSPTSDSRGSRRGPGASVHGHDGD